MKKSIFFNFILIISFIGCGIPKNDNDNNYDTYDYTSYTSSSTSQYDASLIKVSISDNNEDIHMDIQDIGNWGSYYVGATSSNDNFEDNPIEAATLYQNFMLDCTKEDETDKSITYYCTRTLNYNGSYYSDTTGFGNYLKIYKNTSTYLYIKPILGNTAYIVGVFNYENGKVTYSPYKKTQEKNLLTDN